MPNCSRRSLCSVRFEQLGEVGELVLQDVQESFPQAAGAQDLASAARGDRRRASLPVVSLTAAFGGLVFGFQTYIGFHRYIGPGSEAYGGPDHTLGLAKELIPILVGPDGLGPGGLVHGGGDRDDEDHRADRRPLQPRAPTPSAISSFPGRWPRFSCCPA